MEAKDTVMEDEKLEVILRQITQADIGFDGRRLTKFKVKYETLGGWEECYEPTPFEFAREIAQAQAEISFELRTEDILKQLNGFNQRGLTITEAIALLQ